MGEGCGNDDELMDYVTSINIACGYHAGDLETMQRTVSSAVEKGVAIGAHPGYPDRENFGRFEMELSTEEIFTIVRDQVLTLQGICIEVGAKLSHVKPHGALYNQSAKDATLAGAIAESVFSINPELLLFGLSGSVSIAEAQRRGLNTASEVFADRTYQADGSLTPRTMKNAVITDTDLSVRQVLSMINDRLVKTTDGNDVSILADSICIHGDGENAVEFAKTIRNELARNKIEIVAING